MEKVCIGVLGAARGGTMIEYCRKASNAVLVAADALLPTTKNGTP